MGGRVAHVRWCGQIRNRQMGRIDWIVLVFVFL